MAKAYREEAEEIKKSAEQTLAQAEYERGQAEHARREIAQIEKGVAERERRLAQLNEAELVAREQAAEAKLAEAQELMRNYDQSGHAARLAIIAIDEREKAERSAA